jgi:hypothetical protein
MNLDNLLEQGKLKYDGEIQQRRQKERIAKRRREVENVFFNFMNKNIDKIRSFNVIYPSLKVEINTNARLSVQKYSDKDYSGIAWLEWEFRNDTFDIVFYSSTAYPKKNNTIYDVYNWKKDDLSKVPYDATDEEIKQCINTALVAMLQNYLEI